MNIRVRYTMSVIEESFFRLLERMPLSQITVKEICQLAEVNRTTFYKYYDNPYDLLNKVEERILDALQEQILAKKNISLMDVFQIVLEDAMQKKQYYGTLFSQNGDKMFRKRLFDLCYEANMPTIRTLFPGLSPMEHEWMYYFIAEGCTGILKRWIEGGMKETPGELEAFAGQLIRSLNRTQFPVKKN